MTNKSLCALAFALLFSIASCEKVNELINFKIKHETSFTIPGQNTGIGDLLSIPRAEIKTSSEQTFKNNNTRAELVEEVTLDELILSITAPENESFDFLNEISIYITAEGEQEVLLASKVKIPEDGSRTLVLETSQTNLKPYVVKENYTIRTVAKTDKVVDKAVDVKINMSFQVRAAIF